MSLFGQAKIGEAIEIEMFELSVGQVLPNIPL